MLTQAFTAIVLAGVAFAQELSITTPPSIQQCQPAAFSWVGGTAPYILAAIPQGQTSAPALATIADNVTGNSYTWTVNLAQGTAINVRITDATGAINYSSGLTVQAGSNGCLTGASASASGAVTSAVPASSGAASSAPAGSTTSVTSAAATSRASSASAASSSSAAAASSNTSASGTSTTGTGTSRPATSPTGSNAAASTTNAAGAKAAFNVPVLALAGAGAFVFLGGFAALA